MKPGPCRSEVEAQKQEIGLSALENELLSAVYAAWDSDEPRLVYADWLEDRSDPRGELIQIQCALGRQDAPAGELEALRRRERELRAAAEQAWLGEFYDPRLALRFSRGIPMAFWHSDMFVEIVSAGRLYALRFLEDGRVQGGPADPEWVFDSKWQSFCTGGSYRMQARDLPLSVDLELDESSVDEEYYWRGERVAMVGALAGPGPQLTLKWIGLTTGNVGTRTFQLMSREELTELLSGSADPQA